MLLPDKLAHLVNFSIGLDEIDGELPQRGVGWVPERLSGEVLLVSKGNVWGDLTSSSHHLFQGVSV